MSIWNEIKQLLGFGPTDEEDFDEYDSSVPTYAVERPEEEIKPVIRALPSPKAETEPVAEPVAESEPEVKAEPEVKVEAETKAEIVSETVETSSDDLPGDIFDAIIELFNSTMPEFVAKSLSSEAQRKYIYDHISDSLRARIASTVAVRVSTPADMTEHRQLIDTLHQAREEADALRNEMLSLRTSAEQQKQAFTDRITELDSHLSKLIAEKGQVSTKHSQHQAVDPTEPAEKDAKIEELNSHIESLTSRIKQLDAEVNKARTLNEQLELKATMSDSMINNLQAEASRAREQLAKAESDLAIAAEIQEKLELFEEIKKRKDAKITELTAKVKQLSEQIENMPAPAPDVQAAEEEILRLRDENASLSHTIETNLYNQANAEMKLRSEIKQLRAELDRTKERLQEAEAAPRLIDDPAPASAAPPQRKRRGRPRKTRDAIDGNLDSTDWLDVPEGSRKFDPDFGYHEPPRTVVPDNDAQLSLF
ncbi:MAG: hypothetical protein HDS81_05060 [Bacteroidales bacterium]|nr:hypothetical protein [Bacteroidales bacterium]